MHQAARKAARKASGSTSNAADEDDEPVVSARDRATALASELVQLNNNGVKSHDAVIHPTDEQVAALQAWLSLLETLLLPSAGWTADEIAPFMTKVRGGSAAPNEMPLTTLVLELKHKAMGAVHFDSLDGEKATAYATLESVLNLGPRLLIEENLNYLEFKTWTPVTAESTNHIKSQQFGTDPMEKMRSSMAAAYWHLVNARGIMPFVDTCSWGKPQGQCAPREPPPDDVRDLAADWGALVIVAAVLDGVSFLGGCGVEYVELLEPRLRNVTALLDHDVQVSLTNIEAGFRFEAITGHTLLTPRTLGGLARHSIKVIKVVCDGKSYTSVWIPRNSRGAGQRRDIGLWGNLSISIHETHTDLLVSILG